MLKWMVAHTVRQVHSNYLLSKCTCPAPNYTALCVVSFTALAQRFLIVMKFKLTILLLLVEICNVYIGKLMIKAAKRIFNSDKICRSYSDLNFGITFFGTQCI